MFCVAVKEKAQTLHEQGGEGPGKNAGGGSETITSSQVAVAPVRTAEPREQRHGCSGLPAKQSPGSPYFSSPHPSTSYSLNSSELAKLLQVDIG